MADLVSREPYRGLTLREAMDRLFEESFLRPGFPFGEDETGAVIVPLDLYETENGLVLKAALPGVKPEEIAVTVTGGVLTIKGEFRQDDTDKKKNYLRRERRYGSFSRQVALPEGIDADRITANFEHGVLTLEMPKMEEVKPKSVKITAR